MGYPRFRRARAHKFGRRTTGDITVGTSFAVVDSALDFALEAQVGDVIEAAVSCFWGNDAVQGMLDVATMVSAAPVNYFSTGSSTQNANGVPGWYAFGTSSFSVSSSGSTFYTLQAGDISGGLVTLRLQGKGSAAKTIYASGNNHLVFAVKNLGPADPH